MGRPDELMGGRTREGGGEPGAGRDGGAPRSGAAAGADAATAGGAGRAGGDAVGRAGGDAAGRAGGGVGRTAGTGGAEISLAGRLVTSRWRSGVGVVGAGAAGVDPAGGGPGGAGVDDPDPLVGADSVAAAATVSSATRPVRAVVARAGFCSAGSSGETARRSPSLSALRRTRSAWASSIEDEWLFTPMPNATQRSRASLFVRPSSRASS
jgi:hypothetical protein